MQLIIFKEAIDSVINPNICRLKLIIVDDGSDHTKEVIYKNVKLLIDEAYFIIIETENKVKARNFVYQGKGIYLAFFGCR
jgi:glycosyltransferase involved in cell wall biosynthesis